MCWSSSWLKHGARQTASHFSRSESLGSGCERLPFFHSQHARPFFGDKVPSGGHREKLIAIFFLIHSCRQE